MTQQVSRALKAVALALAIFFMIFGAALRVNAYSYVYLTDIYYDDDEITLDFGETYTVTFYNESLVSTQTWTSGNESIVTVDQTGVVTAVGFGVTYICVTGLDIYDETYTQYLYFYVPTVSIYIEGYEGTYYDDEDGYYYDCDYTTLLAKGATKELTIYNSSYLSNITWTSSDTTVATVDANGVVTGVSYGSADISVTGTIIGGNTFNATITFYVSAPEFSSTSVGMNIYGLSKDDNGYYYIYDDSNMITITNIWDDSVVNVTTDSSSISYDSYSYNGYSYIYIYPKKTGTFTFTVTVDGLDYTCTATAFKAYFVMNSKDGYKYATKKWNSYYSFLCMYKGESTKLKVKGLSGSLTWTSSDTSVATVTSNGKVKAKGLGKATITVSNGHVSLSYPVEVSYKTSVKAIRYAIKVYGATYSQPKRMQTGYYDCSSYVWRSYNSAGYKVGSTALTAAGMAQWCVNNGYTIYYSGSSGLFDSSILLAGDIIFECGESNGRYLGIYHADLYIGNNISLSVNRDKDWSSKYKTNIMVARPCGTSTSGVKAKATNTGVKVSWTKNYGASYEVYRSTSENGTYTKIATVSTNSYLDTTTSTGKKYYYKVRTKYKSKKKYYGKYSSAASVKAKKITKLAATTVSLSSNTGGSVKLSWSKVTNATGYKIYRSTSKSGSYELVATISKGSTKSYTLKNQTVGTTYYYRVVATGKKKGLNSNALKVTVE